jgi:hypothetical protein
VIRQFGTVMHRVKRSYDTVARLEATSSRGSWWMRIARRRSRPRKGPCNRAGKRLEAERGPVRLTATFGSPRSPVDLSVDYLVGNADRALYWGKESGKNMVRYYPAKKANSDAAAHSYLS